MLVYKDGKVKHYKEMFLNTSFPVSGPSDDFLAANGAYKVNTFIEHNRDTHKLVGCDPYVQDGWAYTVKAEPKTAEELAADLASKSAKARAQRDRMIAESDWMVIRAQETGVAMDPAWVAYRQALRDITAQAGFPEVTWPDRPGAKTE